MLSVMCYNCCKHSNGAHSYENYLVCWSVDNSPRCPHYCSHGERCDALLLAHHATHAPQHAAHCAPPLLSTIHHNMFTSNYTSSTYY